MTNFKKITLLVFFSFNVVVSFSQSLTGDIELYLNSIISTLPGSSGSVYSDPTVSEIATWENIIENLLIGNLTTARTISDSVNYKIVAYSDNSTSGSPLYYIVEEKSPKSNYWGTYVLNTNPCRDNLILQAPHPKFDFKTGSEAIFCFKRLSAKALFFSGTHRCNHSSFSSCSGTTSVCGGTSQQYRISDMAHNTETVFQKTTQLISENNTNSVFVQLHGFSKTASDPYVIISNGTRGTPTIDYASLIKNELAIIDNSLTFKLAHIDLAWTKLIAFTNTQGRYLNGSVSPCINSISSPTGNFIHIEQEKTKLRNDSIGWNKMFFALSNAFTCSFVSVKMNEFTDVSYSIYPIPTHKKLTIEANNITEIKLLNSNGQVLLTKNFDTSKAILNLSYYPKGLLFILIKTDNTTITKKIINK